MKLPRVQESLLEEMGDECSYEHFNQTISHGGTHDSIGKQQQQQQQQFANLSGNNSVNNSIDKSKLVTPTRANYMVNSSTANITSFEKSYRNRQKHKRSCDLGKTLGVPSLGHFGTLPIRTHMNSYSDSGQHQLYLRIVTPDDPPSAAPYPILKVIKDKEKTRERIVEKHHQPMFVMVRKFHC